jgi:hypothetical protein
MGGVGVRVGVRVARRVGEALRSWASVALGERLAVAVGLNAGEVGLGPVVEVMISGVADGEEVCVSSGAIKGLGVIKASSPAWTVRAIMVGM